MKPKIGLVLGGGAARGYAHLGILNKLREENISVDFIMGTSIGALIGAVYASGNDIDDLILEAEDMNLYKMAKLLDLKVPLKGLIKGDKIEGYLSKYIMKDFNELQIPLYIVTNDLETKKEVIISQGSVLKAVRASISIPGIFEPVKMQRLKLVDGSILKFNAIDFAINLGADIIINVDVSSNVNIRGLSEKIYNFSNNLKRVGLNINNYEKKYIEYEEMLPELFPVLLKTITMMNLLGSKNKYINEQIKIFTVRPEVGDIPWYRFDRANMCITKGIEAINPVLNDITHELGKIKKQEAK